MKNKLTIDSMKLKDIKWRQHSHLSFTGYYLNTQIGEINGKTIYKHTRTNRDQLGFPTGKGKVTYSETLDSPDLTEQAVMNMIEIARKL